MTKRLVLNANRLSKREVRALIDEGAVFRSDLSEAMADPTARVSGPSVYELSAERFLFVFDPGNTGLGGKGDIWPRETFLKLVEWTQMVNRDAIEGRQGSVANWFFYSRVREELPRRIDSLIGVLATALEVPATSLDRSYASLDLVSQALGRMEAETARRTVYDGLVAYVGEVLVARVRGSWVVASRAEPQPYPYIRAKDKRILMPINVVYEQLGIFTGADLRKATANEVRQSTRRGWYDP